MYCTCTSREWRDEASASRRIASRGRPPARARGSREGDGEGVEDGERGEGEGEGEEQGDLERRGVRVRAQSQCNAIQCNAHVDVM